MTLPSTPSHQTVLTDVSAISIIKFPVLAINPVVPWGWRGQCTVHTASPSLFQLAHGVTALPLLLAHPEFPSLHQRAPTPDLWRQIIFFDYFKYHYLKELVFWMSLMVTNSLAGTASYIVTSQSKLLELFIECFCIFLHN